MSFFFRHVGPVLFPSIVWHTEGPMVHLTFDDGPHAEATPRALEILHKRNIKATFFVLGSNVERHPDLTIEIVKEGHAVGIHGMTHRSMMFRSSPWQNQQIEETIAVLQQVTGVKATFFRPPFGRFDHITLRLATNNLLRTILWNVDSKDYKASSPQLIIRKVCLQTMPGSIILFHDNAETVRMLPAYLDPILDTFEQRNVQCSSL
jgi:peptidoglycan-N-acetylglucosamine deacetylase